MSISSVDLATESKRTFEPLDTVYDVVAPENVAFQYRLAGPFIRAAAWMADMTIVFCWLVLSTAFTAYLLFSLSDLLVGTDFEDVLETFFCVFAILNGLFCIWFWNATFEAFCRGRTPGKAIFGLRSISLSGRPLTVGQALLRNILRYADFMLGPFLLLVMGSNNRMARLGDLAAGTLVVNERLQKKATPAIVFNENKILTIQSRIPDEFTMTPRIHKALSLYVARRLEISPLRLYEIASPMAALLARESHFPYRVDPDAFLCALWQRATGDVKKERSAVK